MSQPKFSTGVYAFLVFAIIASGVVWFIVKPSPILLRCNPSLVDKQYFQVDFEIDYATRLEYLYPQMNQPVSNNTESSIAGKFFMQWTETPSNDQPGEIMVRIL